MVEPKYSEGDEFHLGADGRVRIEEVFRVDTEGARYTVTYLDQPGEPKSPISEAELEEVN